MTPSILAPWRDLAVVLLVIEMFIMALIPGAALYLAVRGVRALKRWIRMPLLQAQVWGARIQLGTARTARTVASVPINLHAAGTQASVTARTVVRSLKRT